MKKTLSNFLLVLFCVALVGTALVVVCENMFGADKVFMFASGCIPVCFVWTLVLKRKTRVIEQQSKKLDKDIGVK